MSIEVNNIEIPERSLLISSYPFLDAQRPQFESRLADGLIAVHHEAIKWVQPSPVVPGGMLLSPWNRQQGILTLNGEFYTYSTHYEGHVDFLYRKVTLEDTGKSRWINGAIVTEETDRNGKLIVDSLDHPNGIGLWLLKAELFGKRRGRLVEEGFKWVEERTKDFDPRSVEIQSTEDYLKIIQILRS